jgi:hypothetical protein
VIDPDRIISELRGFHARVLRDLDGEEFNEEFGKWLDAFRVTLCDLDELDEIEIMIAAMLHRVRARLQWARLQ